MTAFVANEMSALGIFDRIVGHCKNGGGGNSLLSRISTSAGNEGPGSDIWVDTSDILGISPICMRRWRARYERCGYNALYGRRKRIPSPKRVQSE